MSLLVTSIVVGAGCGGAAYAIMTVLQKTAVASTSGGKDQLIADIDKETELAKSLVQFKDSYGSKQQFTKLEELLRKAAADLEREKGTLREIETKLDVAQKQVGEKETAQQEVKSAKVEDESKLSELLTRHQDLSNEAISLEQKLAQSLKNLDAIMDEVELTQDQRAILQELSSALTAAGSRLRDLISEYGGVNERLDALRQQHLDLEDEYTKLVEQQLGD
jgi:chromosome segregation ATPase